MLPERGEAMSKNCKPKRRPALPLGLRDEVLASNGGRCVYCGDPAECVDHITPWSVCQNHNRANLAPSCQDCNSFLSSRDYGSFEEKKAYAMRRVERQKREGFWYFHDILGFLLKNDRLDAWDAADKCGIDRLAFEDILGGHREAEPRHLKAIAVGLGYPGVVKMPARFYCAEAA
jgi:hypothetical protein